LNAHAGFPVAEKALKTWLAGNPLYRIWVFLCKAWLLRVPLALLNVACWAAIIALYGVIVVTYGGRGSWFDKLLTYAVVLLCVFVIAPLMIGIFGIWVRGMIFLWEWMGGWDVSGLSSDFETGISRSVLTSRRFVVSDRSFLALVVLRKVASENNNVLQKYRIVGTACVQLSLQDEMRYEAFRVSDELGSQDHTLLEEYMRNNGFQNFDLI
jgi:hypothetical protein